MPELSPEQRAEREKIEIQYDGAQGAEQFYGHLAALLREIEKRIRDDYTPMGPEDEGDFDLRDKIMTQMRELGISNDLANYDESDEEGPFRDLRE